MIGFRKCLNSYGGWYACLVSLLSAHKPETVLLLPIVSFGIEF